MAIVEDIVVPIAVVSGIGGAIDFYLGSAGQQRVKKWLEDKWYHFHEVNWHNFSEKETRYYIAFVDRIFGASLLSWRRAFVSFSVALSFTIPALFISIAVWGVPYFNLFFALQFLIDVVAFAISISATRWISSIIVGLSEIPGVGPRSFLLLIIFHYALLVLWRPAIDFLIDGLKLLPDVLSGGLDIDTFLSAYVLKPPYEIHLTPRSIIESYSPMLDINRIHEELKKDPSLDLHFVSSLYVSSARELMLSLLANALRFAFALAVLLSFLMRVWFGPVFSTVWARLVESDKPVFTIVFGAVGAIATAIKEVVKLFPSP